jgi:hypothetical protein
MTCRPLPLTLSFLALASTVAGCGSAENEGFPPKPEDIPQASFNSPAAARWKLLAKELRIDDGTQVTDDVDLTAKLSKVSSYLTSADAKVQAEYTAKRDAIALQYAKESYKTRCAAIDLIQEISAAKVADATTGKVSDFAGAKLYLMNYRLQADAKGTAEPTTAVRSGLVVLPTTSVSAQNDNTKKYPLVAYGHGGDNGLSYSEIMAVFGQYQGNHIVVAPSFPGEPVCKGGIDYGRTDTCDKDGKIAEATKAFREPFITDTDEFLGIHDCLVRASMGVSTSLAPYVIPVTKERDAKGTEVTTKAFQTFLTGNVKRIGGTPSSTDPTFVLPVSYMAGLSRGGLTAQLALAKAGGTLGTLSAVQTKVTSEATAAGLTDAAQIGTLVKTEVEKVVGTGFFQPPRFSCAIDFFGPSTFLATSYRLGLEAFVKGYGNKTSFYDLPTGEQLFERWKAYGEGVKFKKSDGTLAANDAENAKAAAELIFKMDVPLQSPLILGSLRNWNSTSSKKQGSMLILHGLFDKVVPAAQSQVSSTIYFGVNAKAVATGALPGVNVDALGLTPPAAFLTTGADGKPALKGRALQHGDAAFFTSTYTASLTQCATGNATLDAACKASNAALDKTYAKATPQAALAKWLSTDCAASTAP